MKKTYQKGQKLFGFKIPIDGLLSVIMKRPIIDILLFDEKLANKHTEYNPDKCTYKGKNGYSLNMVISEIYGKEASEFINSLI